MKITYLGTAAAEGFPALFCNCDFCKNARLKGGKNIRTRSQSMIDDNLLIDFPADAYMHALKGDFRFDKIETLLFTHSHLDHCYLEDLKLRGGAFAHDPEAPTLHVYCNAEIYDKYLKMSETANFLNVEFHSINAFDTFMTNGYKITALPANHMHDETALFYIIEKEGKKLLYANDTGYFCQEVFDYIAKNKVVFDMVSYDCTNVEIPIADTGRHMGIPNILRLKEKLQSLGAIKENTLHCITHFSHNGNPDHERLISLVEPFNMLVAYDGLTVEI